MSIFEDSALLRAELAPRTDQTSSLNGIVEQMSHYLKSISETDDQITKSLKKINTV